MGVRVTNRTAKAATQSQPPGSMDPSAVISSIDDAFDKVEQVVKDGTWFFFFDSDHMFPFATLVTNDLHDTASDLERPGVYRLNIGVSKETWIGLFGEPTKGTPGDHGIGSGSSADWDFTKLDTLMPHPVYGRMHWVCVLCPSEKTFDSLKPLLAEAYELNVARSLKKESRQI
jgi:Family of unknown function (DUF6194)